MSSYYYRVGGSLRGDEISYVVRQADHQLEAALEKGELCYIFNSRQMGKSSLLVRMKYRLQQQGHYCSIVDMTGIGSEAITPEQWYKSFLYKLWMGLEITSNISIKNWWNQHTDESLIFRLNQFIENEILSKIPDKNIYIFIDEIDNLLSLPFPVDDFLALIRYCYNQRTINPEYNRLIFTLCGVATPTHLIQDRKRTPFNIGTAIELKGFQSHEVQPLILGLEEIVEHPQKILQAILDWTDGQPFLTQKLCRIVQDTIQYNGYYPIKNSPGSEELFIEELVRSRLIYRWQSQDEPEHLRTIRDRLDYNPKTTGRLLGIYQQLLKNIEIKSDDSYEQAELFLSGLVVQSQGYLKIKNRIYQEIFNLDWVNQKIEDLRPYAESIEAWIASGKTDKSRLLWGQALREAQQWAQTKNLSHVDYQFLADSQELERQELQNALDTERLKEVEARLKEEKQRRLLEQKTTQLQRFLLATVTLGLILAVGSALITYRQYHEARISEIKALRTSAEGLFNSNQRLDAILAAIKAQRKLLDLRWGIDPALYALNKATLEKTIYGLTDYNRLVGHQSTVLTVAYSPDGQQIATAGGDKTIKLWKPDGTLVNTLIGHQAMIRKVVFSPDGQWIASGGDDQTIRLWQRDGQLSHTLKGSQGVITNVKFSPDSQLLASSHANNEVKLWRRNGTLLTTLLTQNDHILDLAWSSRDQLLALGAENGNIQLWKIQPDGVNRRLQTFKAHQGPVIRLSFSPDGQYLASGSYDKTAKLWKPDGTLLHTFNGHDNPILGLAISSDSQKIATSGDNVVKLWGRDGTLLKTFLGHSGSLQGLAFSPDGQTLISVGSDGIARLWKSNNPFVQEIKAHEALISNVTFTADSKQIVTASVDKTVKFWNRQGQLLNHFSASGPVVNVVISPDGSRFMTGGADSLITLGQMPQGTRPPTLIRTLSGHQGWIPGLAFSSDGQFLVSGSIDGILKLWMAEGQLLKTWRGHQASIWRVQFIPHHQKIVSSSADGIIKIWSQNGDLLKTIQAHESMTIALAVSSEGQLIASGGSNGQVKLWNQDGTVVKMFKGHGGSIGGIAFSPDSQIVATAGLDQTIKLWTLDGTLITTLVGEGTAIRTVNFSPDGTQLISGSSNQILAVWNLPQVLKLQPLQDACNLVKDYLRTNIEVEKSDRNLCQLTN